MGLRSVEPKLLAEELGEEVELDAAAPEVVERGRVLGPGGLATVDGEGPGAVEVEGGVVEHGPDELGALAHGAGEDGVDLEGGREVAALEIHVERADVAGAEAVDVLPGQVELGGIELLAVIGDDGVEVDLGEGLLGDVQALEQGGGGARLHRHGAVGGEGRLGRVLGPERGGEDEEGEEGTHKGLAEPLAEFV